MIGCTQPPQWHPEGDVYAHTLMMLDALGKDGAPVSLELALGVLLHDVENLPAARWMKRGASVFPVMTRRAPPWRGTF